MGLRSAFKTRGPSKRQSAWLVDHSHQQPFSRYNEWRQHSRVTDEIEGFETYLNEWQKHLASGVTTISNSGGDARLAKAIANRLSKVDKFGLDLRADFSAEIHNKLIDDLVVRGQTSLTLRDCTIRRIICAHDSTARLVLIDCWVGSLQIGAVSLGFLEMSGGGVLRLECPLPGVHNPFRGSVSITNVKFSAATENAPAFRNMRHHLSAIHNQEAAAIFHSVEMRTLFRQQSRLDKLFNLIYRGISDYDNSTSRPLIWFSTFALMNFIIMFVSNGAVATSDVEGWQRALLASDFSGNALRSATITFIQILNPLGIFGLKHLVIAKTMPLAVSNAILCFAATVSLGFFVFALRRRFRLAAE